jgi:hypothetical protein
MFQKSDHVLKGRGFKPRRKSSKINLGFSRWKMPTSKRLLQQTVTPA